MMGKVINEKHQISLNNKNLKKEQDAIYKMDSKKQWYKANILDQLINDITIKEHMDNLSKSLSLGMYANKHLYEVLHNAGCKDIPNGIKERVDALNSVQTINPSKEYIVVGLTDKGYVCKGAKYVVIKPVFMSEIYKGYCMIKTDQFGNKTIEIDENKKADLIQLWRG